MSIFDRIVEERIRAAMEEGKFDDLPGKGQPLKMDDNPHEAPEWRNAHTLLRKSGHSLPWLEVKKEIDADIEKARARLRSDLASRYIERQPAIALFSQAITAINHKIMDYNLQAPSAVFHRSVLILAHEIETILRDESNSGE